jgi:hypothetical protein
VPTTKEQRALEEALDRLLDPVADDWPADDEPEPPPMPEFVPLSDAGPSMRHLAVRLRWSDRGGFRIARQFVGWAVGLAAFWTAVWIILSVGGVR